MSGLFEFMAADDTNHRVASRKAVAVASKRCERFYGFLAQAKTAEEYDARAQIIASDVDEILEQTAEEFGVDPDHLASSIKQADLTFVARKPKMCPYHREVVDVSLGTGDPQAGAVAMAQHAYGENSCRGAFDGKCNFKPEMVSQSFWDQRAEQAEQRKLERQQQFEEQPSVQEEPVAEEVAEAPVEESPLVDDAPVETFAEAPVGEMAMAAKVAKETCTSCGGSGKVSSAPDDSDECPSCDGKGYWDKDEKSSKTAEALKTVDVDAGGETASPKINKDKWTPQNVNFIDAEMEGSPHPTIHQDIIEPLNYTNDADDGRFDQTGQQVTEKQDVTQGSELSHSGQGGSFGQGNQAKPVTSGDANPKVADIRDNFSQNPYQALPERLQQSEETCQGCHGEGVSQGGRCGWCDGTGTVPPGHEYSVGSQAHKPWLGAIDPDKNPIREMAKDDFPTEEELSAAIDQFNE